MDDQLKSEYLISYAIIINKYYPKEDDSILENLNSEQYDKIFEMILDNRSINEIKEFLK